MSREWEESDMHTDDITWQRRLIQEHVLHEIIMLTVSLVQSGACLHLCVRRSVFVISLTRRARFPRYSESVRYASV